MPRQPLPRRPGFPPQRAPGLLVGRIHGPVEPSPGVVRLPCVLDHHGVQADVGHAAARDHREPGVVRAHHADVARARAQVVDHDGAAGRHGVPQHVHEVRGRRHRFRHEADLRQPRPRGGLEEHVEPVPAPRHGVGERRRPDRGARDAYGFGGDPVEHRTDQVGHGHRPLAEPHRAVVDAPLGGGLEPGRVQRRGPLGVGAGEDPGPVGPGQNSRGEPGRGVEQQRVGPPERVDHRRDGARGAEVDPEPDHHESNVVRCWPVPPARRRRRRRSRRPRTT